MSNTDKLREIKNQVALSKGYPDWKTMENFIVDHNNLTVVVAQLLVSAMEDVATLHAQQMADKMVEEKLREELIAYDKYIGAKGWIDNYKDETAEPTVDEYLKSREK